MRLSLPCVRLQTTGHGNPASWGRGLQHTTVGNPRRRTPTRRSRLCHPVPTRRRLRAAAPTAKSGRVVRLSGPRGPRHRRARLRHGAHRRGEASAASRPPQARACVVEKVCLSAQPPADRSVQRLIRRRRWTAPATCWAARRRLPAPRRLGNALERTLRLPSPLRPPKGAQRLAPAPLRSARARLPLAPNTPARGLCRSLRSWMEAALPLLPAPLFAFLPPSKASH